MTLDDIDHRLIALLRQDARTPAATLADKLGVSRGTVANRLRRLEDEHVITGYTVRLRPEAEPQGIRAWMGVQVEGNQTREVVAHLSGEPGLVALHDTNGRWDLLAELRAASTAELSQVLERVRLIKGIRHTETSILLAPTGRPLTRLPRAPSGRRLQRVRAHPPASLREGGSSQFDEWSGGTEAAQIAALMALRSLY